jgi:hypothetical protein
MTLESGEEVWTTLADCPMHKPKRRPLRKKISRKGGVLGELFYPAAAAAVIALLLFPGWVMPAGELGAFPFATGGQRLSVPIVPLRIASRPLLDRYGGCCRPVRTQHYLISN